MKFLQLNAHDFTGAVSCIGAGTIGAGIRETASFTSIKTRLRSLDLAFDLGVNFFDVGESYEDGFTEEIIGRFSKGKRTKIIIGTKFSPQNASQKKIIDSLEGSLRRLRTDYIDLYQMHWLSPDIPLEETMGALNKLQTQGKIKYIGMGNCTIDIVSKANSYLDKNFISTNQIKLNLYKRPTLIEKDYFEKSLKMRLINIAYGILGQGKIKINNKISKVINPLCEKYNANQYQILIAWVLNFSNTMVLTRSMNSEHLKSNVAASNIILEKNDVDLISAASENKIQNILVRDIIVLNKDADYSHKIYTNLGAAINNEFGLYPDVLSISKEIQTSMQFDPVELIQHGDYYSLVQGRMRFWAWIYMYGEDSYIPSVIIAVDNDKNI